VSKPLTTGGAEKLARVTRRVMETDALSRTLTSPDVASGALKLMLKDKGVTGTEWSELWDLYDKNEDQVLDRDEILQIILDQLKTCKAIIKMRGDDIDVSSVIEGAGKVAGLKPCAWHVDASSCKTDGGD
jgi:hypothetical protein